MKKLLFRSAAALAAVTAALASTVAGIGVATVAALPYIAEMVPLELSRIVATDGRRQVEMIGMAHLAEPRFYQEVGRTITDRREAGWLVFYEEVKADMDDPAQGLSEVMSRIGAEWKPQGDQHPYELIAPMLGKGLVLQDNRAILGEPGADVRNVDLTLTQLLGALPAAPPPQAGVDAIDLADARAAFDGMPAWVQNRIRAALQILLATSASGKIARERLPPAMMSMREAMVADAILSEPDRNIVIVYGQAHLDPIWERLAASDPGWTIVSTASFRAF